MQLQLATVSSVVAAVDFNHLKCVFVCVFMCVCMYVCACVCVCVV